MATITVTLKDKGVIDAFNRLQAASQDMEPAMLAIAQLLMSQTMGNFEEQRGPTGEWTALKPGTIRNRMRKKRGKKHIPPKILVDDEKLRDSISTQFGADFARIGTDVPYAAIHQFGGDIERAAYSGTLRLRTKNRKGDLERRKEHPNLAIFANQKHKRFVERRFEAAAYTIHIPARPFLPFLGTQLQDGVEGEILETLRRFLGAALDGS